ncbi:hypothetical protein PUNSTDRAFT_48147, partial [Punctularia strigosozonata HHB-11173 SS5]
DVNGGSAIPSTSASTVALPEETNAHSTSSVLSTGAIDGDTTALTGPITGANDRTPDRGGVSGTVSIGDAAIAEPVIANEGDPRAAALLARANRAIGFIDSSLYPAPAPHQTIAHKSATSVPEWAKMKVEALASRLHANWRRPSGSQSGDGANVPITSQLGTTNTVPNKMSTETPNRRPSPQANSEPYSLASRPASACTLPTEGIPDNNQLVPPSPTTPPISPLQPSTTSASYTHIAPVDLMGNSRSPDSQSVLEHMDPVVNRHEYEMPSSPLFTASPQPKVVFDGVELTPRRNLAPTTLQSAYLGHSPTTRKRTPHIDFAALDARSRSTRRNSSNGPGDVLGSPSSCSHSDAPDMSSYGDDNPGVIDQEESTWKNATPSVSGQSKDTDSSTGDESEGVKKNHSSSGDDSSSYEEPDDESPSEVDELEEEAELEDEYKGSGTKKTKKNRVPSKKRSISDRAPRSENAPKNIVTYSRKTGVIPDGAEGEGSEVEDRPFVDARPIGRRPDADRLAKKGTSMAPQKTKEERATANSRKHTSARPREHDTSGNGSDVGETEDEVDAVDSAGTKTRKTSADDGQADGRNGRSKRKGKGKAGVSDEESKTPDDGNRTGNTRSRTGSIPQRYLDEIDDFIEEMDLFVAEMAKATGRTPDAIMKLILGPDMVQHRVTNPWSAYTSWYSEEHRQRDDESREDFVKRMRVAYHEEIGKYTDKTEKMAAAKKYMERYDQLKADYLEDLAKKGKIGQEFNRVVTDLTKQ